MTDTSRRSETERLVVALLNTQADARREAIEYGEALERRIAELEGVLRDWLLIEDRIRGDADLEDVDHLIDAANSAGMDTTEWIRARARRALRE
ncbi:MAG: hypothetical protein GF364_22805 [Candidatus Lokiarchaeota archaeon]|nr:hypothetical protein [Candidatus Lokiarchaeota archaeon]